MGRRKRRPQALPSGSSKSPRPRELLDPKAASASAASDRGSSTTAEGPRNGATSTQAHQPPQSPRPATPMTPEQQVRSIPFAGRGRVEGARKRVPPELATPGPAARAIPRPHNAVRPSAPLPWWGTGRQAGPQTPWRQAAAGTPQPLHLQQLTGASFASVVRGPDNQNICAHLSSRLIKFLKDRFTTNSETTAYQMVSIVLTMVPGRFSIEIDFDHLLECDKELAYAICNYQGRFNEWVNPTVSQFLISKGIAENVAEKIEISFRGMPQSIKPLENFVREQGSLTINVPIFGGILNVCIAKDDTMMLVHGFLVEVYKRHVKGLTWNGEFEISDMVVNSTGCSITKKPMQGGSHCIAKDLQKIGKIFMQKFRCSIGMALYFDVLFEDLANAGKDLVKEEWFWEYLLSHVALKRSTARSCLERGLKHAVKSFGGPGTRIHSILGVHRDWKALIPNELTKNALATDVVLYKVYYFDNEPTEGVPDRYTDTVQGLLAYKRNFLEHGDDYVEIQKLIELELFAAKTFPQALPTFLQSLLRDCNIHKDGRFNELWQEYCNPKDDKWR